MHFDTPNIEIINKLIKIQAYPQNAESFNRMLKKAGLNPVEILLIERNISFQNKEEFIAWLSSWVGGFPVFVNIPEQERTDFIGDVVDCYLGYVPLQGGLLNYASHILYVHAKK